MGFTKNRIKTIIATAYDEIQKEEERNAGNNFINYKSKPHSTILKSEVEAEKTSTTHCYSVSSSTLDFVEQLANGVTFCMDKGKNHMIVKVWHASVPAYEAWIEKWGPHHQKNINKFFLNPTNPKTKEVHKMTIEVEQKRMWETNTPKPELKFDLESQSEPNE